jgi:hypothetical protein
LGYSEKEYFEITEAAERETPQVSFGDSIPPAAESSQPSA